MSKFSERLAQATNEDKQVNPIYVNEIAKTLPRIGGGARLDSEQDVYSSIKTDGVYRCYYLNNEDGTERNFLLQLECKLDIDFNNSADRAKVLLQVCCYLRQIHDDICGFTSDWKSSDIPVVVVLGSKINCMALHTKWLLPFAQKYITGYKSASTAYLKDENKQLLLNIENDSYIQVNSIVYDVNDKDCIKNICDSILKLGQGISITDDLTENNISKAFDFFDMYVLDKKQANKLTSRQKVDLFIGTFYSADFREDKTDRWALNYDILRLHGLEIKVDPIKYNNFKLVFNMRQYSKLEQKRITAITDRLIDDTDRRRKGDFYTPSIWVDEAHKLLSKNLGDNWKEEYMVWDCAWGTGNLTRDYRFKDLYCSTLHNEDLNIGTRYNQDACKFQYDFLNDDVEEFEDIESTIKSALSMRSTDVNLATSMFESAMNQLRATKLYKCAPGLIDGLMGWNGKEKKKLLFFINPPYRTPGGKKNMIGVKVDSGKESVSTKVNKKMKKDKIGGSNNLYTQFIYRILILTKFFSIEFNLGIFCPPLFMQADLYNDIEGLLHNRLVDGFYFSSGEFDGTQSNWGIAFTLWGNNIINDCIYKLKLGHTQNGMIEYFGEKEFKKCLNKYTEYTKNLIVDKSKIDCPLLNSAIVVAPNSGAGVMYDKSLGYISCKGNIVDYNTMEVYLLSSAARRGCGFPVTEHNFNDVMMLFSARKLISGKYANWINCKDEYNVPNKEHAEFGHFWADSLVYGIFNTSSNQASLRNVEYFGKRYDVYNQWFWLSRKYIEALSNGAFDRCDINNIIADDLDYDNAKNFNYNPKIDIHGNINNERYMYLVLLTNEMMHDSDTRISPDAQAVLDRATELVKLSFRFRKDFNEKHPEYHINTWDAGWYQIKGMLKEYMPNELKEFNSMYKALEDRMRPLVYELGFLYK